jgi:DNA-directed RNA polymerase specialized sigma24 family protein
MYNGDIMAKRRDPNSRHYVDNKEFLEAITEYREKVLAAKESGEEKPRVPEYLGECMVKIANHLAYKSNFVNYTFRDEMILDGIENCITYIDNFDPAKSKNPFAYFTQITYYAFIRRIQKEKRQMDTKKKYIGSLDIQELMTADSDGNDGSSEYLEYIRKAVDDAAQLEEKHADQKAKLKKRRPKYLDDKEALKLAKEKLEVMKDMDGDKS